jgi:splicing suppressor protein 51
MIGEMITADWKPKPDAPMGAQMAGLMRLASSTLTMPLTILAGLELVCPDVSNRTKLSLHFIGAATRELEALMVFEEIIHLLPSLKNLNLTFIGPHVPKTSVTKVGIKNSMNLECCPDCKSMGRTRSLGLWNGAYHEYVKEKGFEEPDLAIALHTGFSQDEQESWLPTVQYLATSSYPTLFTTYNEKEMKEETTILERAGATFLQKGKVNKWKGACPILEAMEEEENALHYLNMFGYIVAPKKV